MLSPSGTARDAAHNTSVLGRYISAIPRLIPHASPDLIRPSLWHTDLNSGNIFLSESALAKGEVEITSIIDWQGICIQPMYLAARIPRLIRYRNQYALPPGREMMGLPDNFKELDDEEKETVREDVFSANLQKAYEGLISRQTTALDMPYRSLRVDPSRFAPLTWENGFIPVRAMHRF